MKLFRRSPGLAGLLLLGWVALGAACSSAADTTPEGGIVPITPVEAGGRLVEEGDLVKTAGSRLYVLSVKRGFMVVDLANPAAPRLVAVRSLVGTPLELYLRNGWAFVLQTSPGGSVVSTFDLSDPSQLPLSAVVHVAGELTDSRLVGNVLYTVSNHGATVQSTDLSDPAHPRAVDVVSFPASAQGNHLHMTDTIFFLAALTTERQGECRHNDTNYYVPSCTRITALDTSDPEGRISIGATTFVQGALIDRFGLDHFQGVLRVLVATQRGTNTRRPARLRTLRSADAYQLDPLAAIPLATDRPESLTSVRFDGPRAFAVTFERTDPLFTIDLSAPERPQVLGHLETPGWVDFMIPAGDRLVGIGHDRVETDNAFDPWKLHASIYDVSNLNKPALLDRKLFGNAPEQGIADKRDNWAKVIRVVPELGVLLVPFNAREYRYGAETGQLQLLGFSRDALRLGGLITQQGTIRRALGLGGHVVSISDNAIEVIDVSDVTSPRVLGRLDNSAAAMARLVSASGEVQP